VDEADVSMAQRLVPALRSAAANAGLRAITLASKFLLIVALARFLPPSEVGTYGLMVSAVAFTVFAIGLEYHYYTLRALINAPTGQQPPILRDQAALHFAAAAVILPLLALAFMLFDWTPIPASVIGWFYGLVVVELATTEAGIALVGLSKPLAANLVLFIRSGIWVYAVVILFLVEPSARGVTQVFAAWAFGAIASVAVAAFNMRGLGWRAALARGIDWRAPFRGIRVAAPFVLTTGASLGLLFFDRFVIEAYQGLALVGVYVLFGSITTALHTLVNTGVSLVRMPRLVSTYRDRDLGRFQRELRVIAQLTVVGVLVLVPTLALGIVPTVGILDQALYRQFLPIFYALLVAAAIRCVADIPLYALYAQHRDMALLGANLTAFSVSVALNLLLVPLIGLAGAAIAAGAGAVALLVVASGLVLERGGIVFPPVDARV
jgi:O-antigen/teichoic acid export membrane protein